MKFYLSSIYIGASIGSVIGVLFGASFEIATYYLLIVILIATGINLWGKEINEDGKD